MVGGKVVVVEHSDPEDGVVGAHAQVGNDEVRRHLQHRQTLRPGVDGNANAMRSLRLA